MPHHVEPRPIGNSAFGAYRKSMLSGTVAAGLAADSEIFQFRWTSASLRAAVRSVTLEGLAGSATAFAAGFAKVALKRATGWSADGTGGNTATLTGNNGKLRTGHPTTGAGTIRCASTAALGAGTKTLETDQIGLCSFTIGTAASVIYVPKYALLGDGGDITHPLYLEANEGFVLTATVPATGTWQFGVTVEWSEVEGY